MSATVVDVAKLDPSRIVEVDLFSDETRGRWLELAAEWAQRPPFYVVNFGMPQAVVSRNREVREVMLAPERFTTTPPEVGRFDVFMGLPTVLQLNGPPHTRIRRILQPWFGPTGIARLEEAIDRHVNELIDELEAMGDPVDLVRDFAWKLIPRIMLGTMFRIAAEQQAVFIRMNEALESVARTGGYTDDYLESFEASRAAIDSLIAARELEPDPSDFIGGLVAGRNSGDEPISDDEIAAQVFAICIGALSTTSTETAMVLHRWMTTREEFEILRERPELLAAAVEEALRLRPAALFTMTRFVVEDTVVGGTPLFRGMPLHVCLASADLDPEVYPEPLKFDIRRDPKQVKVFGAGPHFCLGNILARKIIASSLRAFMDRHPNTQLVEPDWKPSFHGMLSELAISEMPVRLSGLG